MLARLTLPGGGACDLSYEEWGDSRSPRILFCVHGLTRNAMDFEKIGKAAAAKGFRVIAPDMPGRGKSPKLANAKLYNNLVYASLCQQLLGILGIKHVDWLGTSMGGIIALITANQEPRLIERLILNDVGMVITGASLARIGEYVGLAPSFATRAEAEQQLRSRTATFGIPEAEYQSFLGHSIAQENGAFTLNYDPRIAEVFKEADTTKDIDLWFLWKAVRLIPTLLIRGERSDLLTEETAAQMKATHPMLTRFDVMGVGHAPALLTPPEADHIMQFLQRYRSLPARAGLRCLRLLSPYNQAVQLKKLVSRARRHSS
jgi:pimeloyl-ACP methyl ester carboxylesterase